MPSIKITYSDADTGEELTSYTVAEIEFKILDSCMVSTELDNRIPFIRFHRNWLYDRIRKQRDVLCEAALTNGSQQVEPLSQTDKRVIGADLLSRGYVLSRVKDMPETSKNKIVNKATVISGKEQNIRAQAEFEAGLGG